MGLHTKIKTARCAGCGAELVKTRDGFWRDGEDVATCPAEPDNGTHRPR